MDKRCPGCSEVKPDDAFNKDRKRKDGLQAYCRDCEKSMRAARLLDPKERERVRVRARASYAKVVASDPEGIKDRMRRNTLWSSFKMTLEQYDAILAEQGGKCANPGCKATHPVRTDNWCVDHDHTCCPRRTSLCGNCNRGLLCHNCNLLLGYASDDIAILEGAIAYLKQYERATSASN